MASSKENIPEQRKVVLEEHNPEWLIHAEQEKKQLLSQLPIEIIDIHHIGSTSIPGIKAKPILDFVLEIQRMEDLMDNQDILIQMGYRPKGESGIPGRQFFTKDTNGSRSHHLHAFETGHPDIIRHIAFRDYLRSNPEAARKYEELKERLAQRFPQKSGDYTEAKSDFILTMDQVARSWYENYHS
jgi:GrpB-like predicted nucleotidyltransferase (UPF0157 family)